MMLELPNGTRINLEDNIELKEKLDKVNKLISEWEHLFESCWLESENLKYFLDGLANYLVWHKEPKNKGKEDKDVMSIWKIEVATGVRSPICIPFTYLNYSQKEMIGEDDVEDIDYE